MKSADDALKWPLCEPLRTQNTNTATTNTATNTAEVTTGPVARFQDPSDTARMGPRKSGLLPRVRYLGLRLDTWTLG